MLTKMFDSIYRRNDTIVIYQHAGEDASETYNTYGAADQI